MMKRLLKTPAAAFQKDVEDLDGQEADNKPDNETLADTVEEDAFEDGELFGKDLLYNHLRDIQKAVETKFGELGGLSEENLFDIAKEVCVLYLIVAARFTYHSDRTVGAATF